jgi:hypothetical protein
VTAPRRRKSKLAGTHPAHHQAGAEPPPDDDQTSQTADQTDQTGPQAASVTALAGHRQDQDEEHRRAAAKARKTARDAAWGWSAAHKRITRRSGEWAAAMAGARELGATPGVLRECIAEAAAQASVPEAAVPAEVWTAAGLSPPPPS